jgi:hypothetical protein
MPYMSPNLQISTLSQTIKTNLTRTKTKTRVRVRVRVRKRRRRTLI